MNDNKNDLKKLKVAFMGNPNVGKSTLFNLITGLNQHTGNWPGKTVASAVGYCKYNNVSLTLVDIPGTYSLVSHSPEEEIAVEYLLKEKPDITVVVCEAITLIRSMNLVLQILEITKNIIVCVNLIDEAESRGITVDCDLLQKRLGVPVITTNAHKRSSRTKLLDTITEYTTPKKTYKVAYSDVVNEALSYFMLQTKNTSEIADRWIYLRLLESNSVIENTAFDNYYELKQTAESTKEILRIKGADLSGFSKEIVQSIYNSAKALCDGVIVHKKENKTYIGDKFDKLLSKKLTGIPIMLLLLLFILWITIELSNYPSEILSKIFFGFEKLIRVGLNSLKCPEMLNSLITDGIIHVVAWVVSVMLPPMAIFFPLFTFLEDVGLLPRIAYNFDLPFQKCNSCGKQALTMCMGLGCNASAVIGCRIIDSKKDRTLAILTNAFMPCNGRFPALISIITMFLIYADNAMGKIYCVLILTAVIVFSVIISLVVTKTTSLFLKNETESSYTLEIPPYRKPQILKILYRSLLDRTIFVLGRAVTVAIPAGVLMWGLNNLKIGDTSLMLCISELLNPIGRFIGLDGAVLSGFIFGFPANEIVLPITSMIYSSGNNLIEISNLTQIRELFLSNGWTVKTAICTMIFFICHWPCSTTILTVRRETGSMKYTVLTFIIPTIAGIILCSLLNLIL